jgi:hypothetical protein
MRVDVGPYLKGLPRSEDLVVTNDRKKKVAVDQVISERWGGKPMTPEEHGKLEQLLGGLYDETQDRYALATLLFDRENDSRETQELVMHLLTAQAHYEKEERDGAGKKG